MRVTSSVENYNKIAHNQSRYKEFESMLSDKLKETDRVKDHMKTTGFNDEKNMKGKFSYNKIKSPFGSEARADYNDAKENKSKTKDNDLALMPGMTLQTKYGISLSITDHSVIVDYGNKEFTDEQYSEVEEIASGLNSFIASTNGKSGRIHLSKSVEKELMSIFKSKGVDINKPFVINNMEYNIKEHEFLEKSGVSDMPSTDITDYMLQKQLNAYGD